MDKVYAKEIKVSSPQQMVLKKDCIQTSVTAIQRCFDRLSGSMKYLDYFHLLI